MHVSPLDAVPPRPRAPRDVAGRSARRAGVGAASTALTAPTPDVGLGQLPGRTGAPPPGEGQEGQGRPAPVRSCTTPPDSLSHRAPGRSGSGTPAPTWADDAAHRTRRANLTRLDQIVRGARQPHRGHPRVRDDPGRGRARPVVRRGAEHRRCPTSVVPGLPDRGDEALPDYPGTGATAASRRTRSGTRPTSARSGPAPTPSSAASTKAAYDVAQRRSTRVPRSSRRPW